MQTVIVLIPVDFHNARKVCENIQNNTYTSEQQLGCCNLLRTELNKELGIIDEVDECPIFFDLNDFMDECNDQYINMENYFLSYVTFSY
jgi:hypothetical protein